MPQRRFTLGTFDNGTGPFPGLVVDKTVYDARQVVPHPSVAALLADWEASLPALTAALEEASAAAALTVGRAGADLPDRAALAAAARDR